MNRPTHPELVRALVKPGAGIVASLTPEKADLWHAVTGIVGEAGELIDAIKKNVVYNKPLDRGNVIEELGDLEFYMEQLRQRLGITREECLEANITKLLTRYEGMKYSDQAAQERKDKGEGEMSRWKYIIVSLFNGEVYGTNDEKVAANFRTSQDDLVIDCEKQMWLFEGRERKIKELK